MMKDKIVTGAFIDGWFIYYGGSSGGMKASALDYFIMGLSIN